MTDYPAIRRWHANTGSMCYYTNAQVALAKKDGAPGDAIYRRDDGTWATVRDLAPDHDFRVWYEGVTA